MAAFHAVAVECRMKPLRNRRRVGLTLGGT
jgi:hypothetical protein